MSSSSIGAHSAIGPLPIYDPTGEMMRRGWELVGRVGLDLIRSIYGILPSTKSATNWLRKTRGIERVQDLESYAVWFDQEEEAACATMDSILTQLLAFPPHPPPVTPLPDAEFDKQIKTVVQLLNQTPANKLVAGVPNGGDLLDVSH